MTFEQYIEGMSVRDMVGQLICPAIRVAYRENSDPREYFEYVFKDPTVKPGSVFFFPGNSEKAVKMAKKLKNHLGGHPLIAMDMETSPNCLSGCADFGSAMAISAADSLEDARICGSACALQGMEHGVSWSFGPAADLNINPNNPIMNIRSWGDESERVGNFTSAFVKGMQENGMIATAKHFPGDGMDSRDQHLCTSVNSLSKEEWMSTYGKVWKRLIREGIRAIMPGHIALPAFEKDNRTVPATISHTLLTELLRNELGFDGIIVSDGMNMGGLAPYVGIEEGIIKMVQAGCDVLIFVNFWAEPSYVVDVLENAVNTGKISIERVKQSIYRIWREKNRLGLFDEDKCMLYHPCSDEKKQTFADAAQRIARNSISIYKNENGVLPLNKDRVKKVISVDVTNTEAAVDNKLDSVLRDKGIEIVKYGKYTENGVVSVMQLPKADALLLNFYYMPVWGSNHIAPNGVMLQRIYEYIFKAEMPVVIICHGSPYIVNTFPYAKTVINTFSFSDVDANAIYDVLFGNREAKGVTPVTLP